MVGSIEPPEMEEGSYIPFRKLRRFVRSATTSQVVYETAANGGASLESVPDDGQYTHGEMMKHSTCLSLAATDIRRLDNYGR